MAGIHFPPCDNRENAILCQCKTKEWNINYLWRWQNRVVTCSIWQFYYCVSSAEEFIFVQVEDNKTISAKDTPFCLQANVYSHPALQNCAWENPENSKTVCVTPTRLWTNRSLNQSAYWDAFLIYARGHLKKYSFRMNWKGKLTSSWNFGSETFRNGWLDKRNLHNQ